MTMGAGAALMEERVVDKRFGLFVNHDLAGYEVPVHADIAHQDVIFLDEVDETISPAKAKGVGELGIRAWRRPSPMRSITRPASACAATPSRSTNCWTTCRRPRCRRKAPGRGQVAARVRHAAINPIDWKLGMGDMKIVQLPVLAG